MIKIPITEKMLLEWLMNTDYNGKPFSKELMAFIDEYNRLEDELKRAMRRNSQPNKKLYDLVEQLHDVGVSPNGRWTKDGMTGEEFWISPKTTEKCNSNPRFKQRIDELIARYRKAVDEDWNRYVQAIEPYVIEFNEFHNAHIKELNFIERKLYGSSASIVKKRLPVNKIPDDMNLI